MRAGVLSISPMSQRRFDVHYMDEAYRISCYKPKNRLSNRAVLEKSHKITYGNPVVSWTTDTTDARGSDTGVTQGRDKLFSEDFLQMSNVGLVVVILQIFSHRLAGLKSTRDIHHGKTRTEFLHG